MDRIVWNSEIAGEFTDELRGALMHLEDDEATLRMVWISLDEAQKVSHDSALKQITFLLEKVRKNIVLLDAKTADMRASIYHTMELFESAEKRVSNLTRDDAEPKRVTGTAKAVAETGNNHTVFVRGTASRVDPGWLSDLASGMHHTMKRG